MTHESAMPTQCPLCLSMGAGFAFEKASYRHYECRACGSLYVHPRPTEEALHAFYSRAADDPTSSICWESSRRHVWGIWEWALGRIADLAGRGPLLDVGCGSGQFLAFAQERGWSELWGIELSEKAAERARQRARAEIHTTGLAETALPPAAFHGIAMWDLIEHVPDVRQTLREAHRLLKPGGVLVLSTPNRGGLSLRVLGARALVVMPPEHLTYMTRRGIEAALCGVGFRPVACRQIDIFLREWTRLVTRGGASPAGKQSYGGLYEKLTGSGAFIRAMTIVNGIMNGLCLGDQMIVAAVKTGGAKEGEKTI